MAGLTGWHLVILIAVVVLLFGAKRLPDMARAVGQSARIFKTEIKQGTADPDPQPEPAEHRTPSQPSSSARTYPPSP